MLDETTLSIPAPPSQALLTHNDPPLDVDRWASQHDLLQTKATVAELQQLQHQHALVVSPQHRVPNEILGEIMKYTMPGLPVKWRQNVRTASILASVCSRWRDTATSTPQLWTIVEFRDTLNCIPLAQLVLCRSGDLPLVFKVRRNAIPIFTDISMFAITIRSHWHRICHLDDRYSSMKDIIIFGPPLRCLRTLYLGPFPAINIIKIFEDCPALEDVHVTISHTDNTSISSPLRRVILHHLRRLVLWYRTEPSALVDFLTAPNLTEFQKGRWDPTNTTPWPEAGFWNFLPDQRSL